MAHDPVFMSDRPESTGQSAFSSNQAEDDVMADVLRGLGLESRLFCRTVLSAPWAIAFPAGDIAHFHAIERGGAWLETEAVDTPVPLAAGDVVVLPRRQNYALVDQPGRTRTDLRDLLHARRPDGGCLLLEHGGGGAEARMLCGSFRFRHHEHPFLELLPPVLHVRAEQARQQRIDSLLALLAAEAAAAEPGMAAVTTRLTDTLFVLCVRHWLRNATARGSWMAGLRDERVGRALAAMHRSPARAWTVAELAAAANWSRSPFAARFRELVGEPPLTYLARLRMQRAGRMLREQRATLSEAAAAVGYASSVAFAKAFKRALGQSPGRFRRHDPGRS